MSETRIASRYAKSLIGLAQEQNVLEDVHNDMETLRDACRNSRELHLILRNPIVKSDKKLNILNQLFKGRVNKMTSTFFEIISRKTREDMLEAIAEAVHNQYNAIKEIESATLITAAEVDEATKEQFIALLVRMTGKKIELSVKVNPDLIGGYVLKIKDREIDASMSSRLRDLHLKFAQNPYVKEF